jgi:hypothetical protein
MKNSRRILSIGLAAAALAAVVPFFAGGVLLLVPGIAPFVVQAGLVPGGGPAWFGPVFGISAVVLSAAAFIVSWNQKSFLVAGLLIASGTAFMLPALIATGFLAVIVIPGPILGVIIGLGILGLGIAKGARSARTRLQVAAK